MSNNQKDLALQSYEKKIATTLREERYEIPSLQKNKPFLDNLRISGNTMAAIGFKFYKEQITKLHDAYINDFNDIIMPLIFEKGLNFEHPEERLGPCIEKYDLKISKIIEKLQIIGRITFESFYDSDLIASNWSLCLDGVENVPFMIALGSKRIIVLDENFNMDLFLFASLGAMPDIRPMQKAGNIDLPENTFSINLQIMMDNEFKQISLLLLKQKLENIQDFLAFMANISLVVDTKAYIDNDFSGLKWIKNSLEYSLFKRKEFLQVVKALKPGGLIIDKSISPMQVQKIQSVMKVNANLNIGYDIHKLGILQYSVVQKKEQINALAYDSFEGVICKIPDVNTGKYGTF